MNMAGVLPIRVYSKVGKTGASMVVDEHGGRIRVVGEEGKAMAEMGIYGGGYIHVADMDTLTSGASMRIYEYGGALSVSGGISGASMFVDKDGGVVRVVGEDGKSGAAMGVKEDGNRRGDDDGQEREVGYVGLKKSSS